MVEVFSLRRVRDPRLSLSEGIPIDVATVGAFTLEFNMSAKRFPYVRWRQHLYRKAPNIDDHRSRGKLAATQRALPHLAGQT